MNLKSKSNANDLEEKRKYVKDVSSNGCSLIEEQIELFAELIVDHLIKNTEDERQLKES